MTTTWILVAHRSGARLFQNTGLGKGMTLLREIYHPQGRLRNGDIDADKPGRAFDSMGQGRHAMSPEQEPTERVADHFAKQLAQILDQGRQQNKFQRLVLVAEPRFLGRLRTALNPPTTALISITVDKDLAPIDSRHIHEHLTHETMI